MKLFLLTLWTSLSFALPLETLTDMKNQAPKISHNKNKQLVVLWATWCPTCKAKMADDLPKLNASKDVAVVMINTDRSADRAQAYIDKAGVKLPYLLRDPQRTLRKTLKAFSVPHWAVYERTTAQAPWKLIDTAPAFEWDRINKALGRKGQIS